MRMIILSQTFQSDGSLNELLNKGEKMPMKNLFRLHRHKHPRIGRWIIFSLLINTLLSYERTQPNMEMLHFLVGAVYEVFHRI